MSDTDAHECKPNCRYYGVRYLHDVCVPRVNSEPPCSCASLRAKGHGAECSRCPPVVSPTRAAAEAHREVLGRTSDEAAVYERGGYAPPPVLGPYAHYAGCPGPSGKPCTCAVKDALPATPSPPAAILGEALERAHLVREAFDMLPLEARVVAVEAGAECWRKAEVREGKTPASCWQCEAPLGTTEACLTCAAKRREDAQRTPPET